MYKYTLPLFTAFGEHDIPIVLSEACLYRILNNGKIYLGVNETNNKFNIFVENIKTGGTFFLAHIEKKNIETELPIVIPMIKTVYEDVVSGLNFDQIIHNYKMRKLIDTL